MCLMASIFCAESKRHKKLVAEHFEALQSDEEASEGEDFEREEPGSDSGSGAEAESAEEDGLNEHTELQNGASQTNGSLAARKHVVQKGNGRASTRALYLTHPLYSLNIPG